MSRGRGEPLPEWAGWRADPAIAELTVGIEEEVMLLDPGDWSLAYRGDDVERALGAELGGRASTETHACALELQTGPHARAASAAAELLDLRCRLAGGLGRMGLRAGVAGTHALARGEEVVVTPGPRQQAVYASMRELARREPTFALHVHVKVHEPDIAVRLLNRLRAHLPLLLALSANSPFWRGSDSGLASARTPLFGAFPRTGTPRAFADYADYAETVDQLLRCEAFPDPSYLWWDLRLQPALGTVEVRVMDAQTTTGASAALAALVQALARLELTVGFAPAALIEAPELLAENRFLAARDGIGAELLDPRRERRVPARSLLAEALEACAPHADALGGTRELALVRELADAPGALAQKARAAGEQPTPELIAALSEAFCASPSRVPPARSRVPRLGERAAA